MKEISTATSALVRTPQAVAASPRAGTAGPEIARTSGRDAADAARSFEAMVLGQMLQPMFDTMETDDMFGGGAAEGILKPMLVTEYAKLAEQRGGLGLAPAVQAAMERKR